MGNIPIINPSTRASGNIPQPQASGEAFGAGIGRALQGIGEQIVGLGADAQAYRERAQGVSAQMALAQARLDMTRKLIEMENAAAPGAPDFADNYLAAFDDYRLGAGEGLTGKTAEAFSLGMASLRTDMGTRAMGAGAKAAASNTAFAARGALDTGINTVALDPTQYQEIVNQATSTIDGLGLPGNEREELKREYVNALSAARFQALFNAAKDPDAIAAVRSDLEKGDWKEILGAKTFDDLRTLSLRAETAMRALLKTEATTAIDSVEQRMLDGASIEREELSAVTQTVRQSADEALARRWVKLSLQYETQQQVRPLSTPELRGYIDDMGGQAGGLMDRAKSAIASIESDGSGGYSAVGPKTRNGDRAYGKYQVMGNNVPSWTEAALGRRMSLAEFKNDPAAQEKVFEHRFGLYVRKYGSFEDAASVWFTGRPLKDGANASDGHLTGSQYVARFQAAFGNGSPSEISWLKSRAAQDALDARNKRIDQGDLMGAAADAGIISLSDLTDLNSYRERGRSSQIAAEHFATANLPFTPPEVEKFEQIMASGTIEEKLATVANIAAMGSAAPAAFAQVGEKAPLLGYAGGLSLTQPDIAREILRGEQKLQDNPDFKKVLDTAEAGGTAMQLATVLRSSLDMSPETAYGVRLAADALYAQRAGLRGMGQFDVGIYEGAIRDALGAQGREGGGVGEVNSEPVVLPPGVDETEFSEMLDRLTPSDLVEFSIGDGPPVYADGEVAVPDEITREGRFRSVGVGSYAILMANDLPLFGTGPDGLYVMQIDAKGVQRVLSREPTTEDEINRLYEELYSGLELNATIRDRALEELRRHARERGRQNSERAQERWGTVRQ